MTAEDRDGRLFRFLEGLRACRRFAPLIGGALLVAAIIFLVRSGPALEGVRASLASASPGAIAVLLLSVFASVLLTGWLFYILTRRFGAVGFLEMQALMAATTLANYLPLRPGLLGRVLWHRQRNDIRARDALRTILEAILLSAVALAAVLPALLAGRAFDAPVAPWLIAPACAGALLLAPRRTRMLALAWLIRYAETLLTALRYHVAFALVGSPVGFETSVAVACVSMIATLVPFVSNGIGLREWAIGLLAPLLAGASIEAGIAAELINRAAEVCVVALTGALGGLYLWKRS